MPSSALQSLRIERPEPDIVEVVLLGPSRGNAMGPDFWRETPEVFEQLDRDRTVRAIVVRGEGRTFSVGLDLIGIGPTLMPLVTGAAAERGSLVDQGRLMQRAFNAVAACRQPVIAAIDGWCIGAGVELACACDLRLASAKAKFSLREVKLSIVPDLGGIQRLPFIVGEGHARELALTGADYPAEHVYRIGLVNAVTEDAETLLREARAMARKVADNPPLAVAAVKQVMNARIADAVVASLREALLQNSSIMQSRDFQEALAAALESRPPRYEGA